MLPTTVRIFKVQRTLGSFNAFTGIDYRQYEYVIPTYCLIPILENSNFKLDDRAVERMNSILTSYEGTHNFHNFTIGKTFSDKSAYRFMKLIKVSFFFFFLFFFITKNFKFLEVQWTI